MLTERPVLAKDTYVADLIEANVHAKYAHTFLLRLLLTSFTYHYSVSS